MRNRQRGAAVVVVAAVVGAVAAAGWFLWIAQGAKRVLTGKRHPVAAAAPAPPAAPSSAAVETARVECAASPAGEP